MNRLIFFSILLLALLIQGAQAGEHKPKNAQKTMFLVVDHPSKSRSAISQTVRVNGRKIEDIHRGLEKFCRAYLRSYLPRKMKDDEILEIRFTIAEDGAVTTATGGAGLGATTARMIRHLVKYAPANGSGVTRVLLRIANTHYKLVKVYI